MTREFYHLIENGMSVELRGSINVALCRMMTENTM